MRSARRCASTRSCRARSSPRSPRRGTWRRSRPGRGPSPCAGPATRRRSSARRCTWRATPRATRPARSSPSTAARSGACPEEGAREPAAVAARRPPRRARDRRADRGRSADRHVLRRRGARDACARARDRRGRGSLATLPASGEPAGVDRRARHARAARADGAPDRGARRRDRGARGGLPGRRGSVTAAVTPPLNPAELIARVNRDVERSVLRARNGVRYVRGSHRPQLGATPKAVVWRRGRARRWRYRNDDVRYGPPVAIVHSLVSRSYILDLRPANSLIEYLVDAGLDVFLLDWGVPDERDADNTLDTYVDGLLPRALAAVRWESGCPDVTLAGYCLGGIIAMLYAAGHPAALVRNLILMATPLDF